MSQAAVRTDHAAEEACASTGAIARNAFHLVLGQVATTALAVLLAAALGRSLGAADFGLYYLITSTAGFVYVLVEWGQAPYVIRDVARHPQRAGALLGTALGLRVAAVVVAALLTPALLLLFGYDRRTVGLTALFIGTSLPLSLAQACGMVFRGRERMDLDALVSVINKVLVLGLTVAAFAMGAGLLGATLAQGVAGAGALAVAAVLIWRIDPPRLAASWPVARELLVGGTPIVAMTLTTTAQAYIDVLVLSKLSPSESVGWYGAARNIFGTMGAAGFILGSAAFPRLSRAAHQPAAFRAEITTALRPLLGLAALASVGCFLFADLAVGIVFGNAKFAPAAAIIRLYAPAQVLLYVDVLLGMSILAVGRAKWLAMAKAFNLVAAFALDVVLVPVFERRYGNGGLGIVLSFLGSELLMFAAMCWILPRGTLRAAMMGDVLRALVASAGTLLLFRLLPPLSPVVALPLCVLAFVALGSAAGLVRRSDVEAITSTVARRTRGG
jgi:O-antigen/teichoic acid export membrane protein